MPIAKKPRVLLINMPWAQVQTPSIQLGILKSSLSRNRIDSDVAYLNLAFAKKLGIHLYDAMISDSTMNFFCEWLFRDFILDSPGSDQNADSYLEYLQSRLLRRDQQTGVSETTSPFQPIFGEDYLQRIKLIKEQIIPEFIVETLQNINFELYDVIGFTCMFAQAIPALALARQIKSVCPDKLIVMGGASYHEDMGLEYLKSFSWIDCVVHGEGEEALVEIIQLFRSGATFETASRAMIQGVSWRFVDDIVSNIKRVPITNLDTCPLPDYDDYFNQAAGLETGSSVIIRFESARGCWWGQKHQCNFCGLNGSQVHYRSKSPERVMAELVYLSAKYRCLTFLAVDNVIEMNYFGRLLPKLYELDYHFTIFYEIKANLTKEQVQMLANAGIRNVQPGIESFHSAILKLMSKGTKAIQNIQLLKWCKEFKIETIYNLLWGFPGENHSYYEEMAVLIPKLIHLMPPSYPPRRLTLERFSPYFQNPGAFGIKNIQPAGDYRYLYPKEVDLSKIAYIFSYTSDQLPDDLRYIHEVTKNLKKWHDRYYSSKPALLFFVKGPGFTEIYDTRFQEMESMVLEGLISDIYQYCDQIRSLDSIKRFFVKNSKDDDQGVIENLLNQLVEMKVMIQEGDRFLSLALPKRSIDPELLQLLNQ
jgi:ribosomal peptide maturation radical SAM protein 1